MSGDKLITKFKDFELYLSKYVGLPRTLCKNSYLEPDIEYPSTRAKPLSSPKLVAYSKDVLENILNLDLSVTKNRDFLLFFSGHKKLISLTSTNSKMNVFSELAVLREFKNRDGKVWELKLKSIDDEGADEDDIARLRLSLREMLYSEALHHLGIPSSRVATFVVGEDRVVKDIFLDCTVKQKDFAMLRLAPSWFTVGALEVLAKAGERKIIWALVEATILLHFPDISSDKKRFFKFLCRVVELNADLVVAWQSLGFVHGSLPKRSISLLGLTFDHNISGFIENFDEEFLPWSSRKEDYCYKKQVSTMIRNLTALSNILSDLLTEEEMNQFQIFLKSKEQYIADKVIETFSKKLGFCKIEKELVTQLMEMFKNTRADFTMTFRELSETPLQDLRSPPSQLWALNQLSTYPKYSSFIQNYKEKWEQTGEDDKERMERMCRLNPRYILRKRMVKLAFKMVLIGNYMEVRKLMRVLSRPFEKLDGAEAYAAEPPVWQKSS